MFSGITNLIFGSNSTTEIAEAPVHDESSCGLKTKLTEDEWELVDQHSRGSSPARLNSSSLENLLIEHPSMSVYQNRGRPSSTGLESDQESSSDTEAEVDDEPSTSSGSRNAVMSHTSGRSRVITAKQQVIAQRKVQKAMQSVKKHKDHKKLAKSQLQRSNNVVHAKHGKPLRRQHLMQLRNSGAVNDRKSQ